MSDTEDFRGKLLVDNSYSHSFQFIDQRPITDLLPYLETAFASGVKAIKWNQFVPAFNDGDACEFTIHEVMYTSNGAVADIWVENGRSEDVDEEEYPEADYLEDYRFTLGSGHPDGLGYDVLVPIDSAEFEYAVRAEFGDDCTVVITPDATYKFDYECGY